MRHPQLEAQIEAAPADDAPRQVYADWLLEREDPRGELIAAQLELERLPAGHERRQALEQRERELLAEHGPRWLSEAGFPDTVRVRARGGTNADRQGSAVIFRRGFVDELQLELPQLLEARQALLAAPLRRLVLLGVTDAQAGEIEALASLPPLPHLDALGFRQLRVSAEPWSLLASAPILGAVRELTLRRSWFRGGFELLAQKPVRLQKLNLIENSRTQGLEALADTLGELESLDVEGSDARLLWALFRTDRLSSLRFLGLRGSWADDAVVGAVASARTPLVELDLGGRNNFGEEGVQSLVRTRRFARLKVLRLRRRGLTASQIVELQRRFRGRLVLEED